MAENETDQQPAKPKPTTPVNLTLPSDVHSRLKSEAALKGVTLKEHLASILIEAAKPK